ncbi:MAG: DUF177 domain-containing protein [Pseudomonadota bacterium]
MSEKGGGTGPLHAEGEDEPFPLAHPVDVAALSESGGLSFEIAPEAPERALVAQYLGLEALPALAFRGEVVQRGAGWGLEGRLTARMRQSCVVTLDPVETDVEVPVERMWLPDVAPPTGAEIELRAEDDRAPEMLGNAIDLAIPMLEALALEIDPFPRADGAEHGTQVYAPPGSAPLTDEAAKPFAGLAALKARLGGAGGDENGGDVS